MSKQERALGVDFGGVIVANVERKADTSFFANKGEKYLEVPEVAGAIATLKTLNEDSLFAGRVHVVSKCGERIERRSRRWLTEQNFHDKTGIPADNLHFCLERKDKALIAEALGLTDFVDDHLENLAHVSKTVSGLYLFDPEGLETSNESQETPKDLVVVQDWEQLQACLLESA